MHLVIRTLNNRDCGIYIYELYECTLGCKVVKLILYLLPLQPVTRKSGQGRKKNEQKRSKYSTILFSVFYHTEIIQLQSQYYSLYGRYVCSGNLISSIYNYEVFSWKILQKYSSVLLMWQMLAVLFTSKSMFKILYRKLNLAPLFLV